MTKKSKRQMVEDLLGFSIEEWSDEQVSTELFYLLEYKP